MLNKALKVKLLITNFLIKYIQILIITVINLFILSL